ncbi:hypothetical protein BX666DRAFT_1909745 [Dichotomocladium elegans]|nr:hypothetical protein BX666DRAFT_1909745 [Dichotomocladium elegans]
MFSSNQGAANNLEQEQLALDQSWSFDDFIQLDEDPQQQQMQMQMELGQLQPQGYEQQQQQFPQQLLLPQQQLFPQVLPQRLPSQVPYGIQRRRSSSVDTQPHIFNYPPLSYSPESSVDENISPAMVPYDTFFSDLDYLIPSSNEQDLRWQQMQLQQQQQPVAAKPRNFRRRSSSVPPIFHSVHQRQQQQLQPQPQKQQQQQQQQKNKPIIFAQIKVADSRPPPPPPKPFMPVQIERLHRNSTPSPSPEEQRAAMDQRLLQMNFGDVTVAELKQALRHYGHSTTGRKAELIERLQQERERLLQQTSHDHNDKSKAEENEN